MFAVAALSVLLASPLSLPLDVRRADPAVEMEDAYKWIYQATHGGEHAAPDREAAALWLQREWESLEAPAPGEPLIQRGYPALHHSAPYARVRRPAYRVLTADRATSLIARLGAGPAKRQAGASVASSHTGRGISSPWPAR